MTSIQFNPPPCLHSGQILARSKLLNPRNLPYHSTKDFRHHSFVRIFSTFCTQNWPLFEPHRPLVQTYLMENPPKYTLIITWVDIWELQRSAKVLVRGLVKIWVCLPLCLNLPATLTKPRTLANLCRISLGMNNCVIFHDKSYKIIGT